MFSRDLEEGGVVRREEKLWLRSLLAVHEYLCNIWIHRNVLGCVVGEDGEGQRQGDASIVLHFDKT